MCKELEEPVDGKILTEFSNLIQSRPGCIVQHLSVVAFACDIDAENDGLVDHLIKVDSGTQILGHLGLGGHQKVSGNVHEFVEDLQVVLQALVVLDDEGGALLGRDAFVGVIETGQWSHGAGGQIGDGSGEDPGEPYPDCHVPRQGLANVF